ncbi:hypothetical protein MiAbW_02735 [Microcystis aeruginosa NIES-4325]|uniref:Uncharacterized protein n=1 Tax=Microcystis aeruginosa NIES-4325 TaxID=2569534 RepID=A0A5J4FA33_MICAE|nr:hypothetical protein MiAbW_02735 [Microcystis aeruginosa NIES-4325]
MVIIDETGDKKKGKTTDYVKIQYIGNLGKIENGIVAVTAYGLFRLMTFPLIAKVYIAFPVRKRYIINVEKLNYQRFKCVTRA